MSRSSTQQSQIMRRRIVNWFFILSFLGVIILFGQVVLPFVTPLIIASLLGVILFPLFKRISSLMGGNESAAAGIMVLLVVLFVVIPFGAFLGVLSSEAFNFYIDTQEKIESGYYQRLIEDNADLVNSSVAFLEQQNIQVDFDSQRENLLKAAQGVGLAVYESAGSFLGNIAQGLFNGVTILFVLYYLFKDHKKISRTLLDLSPLPNKIEVKLVRRVGEVGKAVFFGNAVTAIVQGVLGGIGFFAAGFGNSIFWGTLVAISSLIPSVGVFLVLIPASAVLFLQGNTVAGFIFLAYSVIIVGSVDNILKPKLIESKINLHPLLVFMGVLGGVLVFGPLGFIYGPLVVTIFVAFVDIYQDYFRDDSFELEEATAQKTKKEKKHKK